MTELDLSHKGHRDIAVMLVERAIREVLAYILRTRIVPGYAHACLQEMIDIGCGFREV